jgi:hypothetical protein
MAKKDYEEKIEELLEGSEEESEEMEVENEEQDLQDLVGVIKSEMDDAKDFIHQVGQERRS